MLLRPDVAPVTAAHVAQLARSGLYDWCADDGESAYTAPLRSPTARRFTGATLSFRGARTAQASATRFLT